MKKIQILKKEDAHRQQVQATVTVFFREASILGQTIEKRDYN